MTQTTKSGRGETSPTTSAYPGSGIASESVAHTQASATGDEQTSADAGCDVATHPLAGPAGQDARRTLLDPERLAGTTERAARALLRQGESTNTRLSYASAMRYWCAWYAARYGSVLALPVPVPVVVQFIVDHAARRMNNRTDDTAAARRGEANTVFEEHIHEAPPSGALSVRELPVMDGAHGPAGATSAPTRPAGVLEAQAQAGAPKGKARAAAKPTPDLVTELPADVDAALVAGGYKAKLGPPSLNTLVHRLAVLSKAHQLAHAAATGEQLAMRSGAQLRASVAGAASAVANPCADPLVRELLARTRRAYAQRGERPKKQRALTKDPLNALLATCDQSLKGKRDRALLMFAFASGGRRRSEVATATLENLQRVDAQSFIYTLTHSKTNQLGDIRPEDVKPLLGAAAQAMNEWVVVLKAHRIEGGAIFRRIRRGDHLAEGLAPAAVRDIVRERCVLAGVEGSFSAHSLRAGFVTEAGKQNLPLAETMALTGHQSVATLVGYFRAESALNGKAGRLLDADEGFNRAQSED